MDNNSSIQSLQQQQRLSNDHHFQVPMQPQISDFLLDQLPTNNPYIAQSKYHHSIHHVGSYHVIETDEIPHTAYYVPADKNQIQPSREPSVLSRTRPKKNNKRTVFTDKKQMPPPSNKSFNDGSPSNRLNQSRESQLLLIQQNVEKEPERYYEEAMQLARAHLEDTAATMQKLRESQSGTYPKVTEATLRKSLELTQALTYSNHAGGSNNWTPGGTQNHQQLNSTAQTDQTQFTRKNQSSHNGNIGVFDSSRRTHQVPLTKNLNTQRTTHPSTTQASTTMYYRTPLTTAGKALPMVSEPKSNSRGASPLQKYTYQMFDQSSPQQTKHNLINISKQGVQFQRKKTSQSKSIGKGLIVPVRHKRGQPQGMYGQDKLLSKINDSMQSNGTIDGSYQQSLRKHLMMQLQQSQDSPSHYPMLSMHKRSFQTSRMRIPTDTSYPASAHKRTSILPTSHTLNSNNFQSPSSSSHQRQLDQSRFASNTNMRFFSSHHSKLTMIQETVAANSKLNSMKKNPSWQQLSKKDLLVNHQRHSKGTIATAQALGNLLAQQHYSNIIGGGEASKMTTITKRQQQLVLSNKSSNQSLHQSSIDNHQFKIKTPKQPIKTSHIGVRNSMDLKTSPVQQGKSNTMGKINVERLYPRKATQVSLKNIMPAPTQTLNQDSKQTIEGGYIVSQKYINNSGSINLNQTMMMNDSAIIGTQSKAGAAFTKSTKPKSKKRLDVIENQKRVIVKRVHNQIQSNKFANPQVDRIKKLQRAYLAPSVIPDESFEKQRIQQMKQQNSVERQFDTSIMRISRQDAVKSAESIRMARSAYGQTRKSKNSRNNNQQNKSQESNGQKSLEEGSLERAIFQHFKRDDSFAGSSCHCSYHKKAQTSRQTPLTKRKKGDTFDDSRNLGGTFSESNQSQQRTRNRHAHGCQDTYTSARNSIESSLKKDKAKKGQRELSKKQLIDDNQSLGVINCPRCMKRLKRVDEIDAKNKKLSRKRRNQLSETQAFESNMFKDVLKDIPRRRSVSQNDSLMRKGLNYKFSLKNLHKYSKKLNAKDVTKTERFSKSAMSRRVPTLTDRVRKLEQSSRMMKDKNRWESLRNQCILQQADWFKSNLYQQYLKYGRNLTKQGTGMESGQIIAVDSIYTETELRYYIELLSKLSMKKYSNEGLDKDLKKELESHNMKSQSTLKWLMRLIGFDYYYERILFRYQKQEQQEITKNLNSPQTIHNVIKVMVRSIQMYETIDQILLIFQLLQKLDRLSQSNDAHGQERHLQIRLIAVIKQLTNNNKFLQRKFIFKGRDIRKEMEKLVGNNYKATEVFSSENEEE